MMVTKAKDELEAAGLCEYRRAGALGGAAFPRTGESPMRHKALPPARLAAVIKTSWLRWDHPGYPTLLRITALSQKTMLADDPLPDLHA